MFLDRQDNRKDIEQAYRKELKNQMDNKRSRIISNKSYQEETPKKQDFSLIRNFQKSQNDRKKKNEQYYDQLRLQMEQNKRQKDQKQAEKKQKELEEENKLRQQQRKLQQRYEQEMKKQNKNKRANASEQRQQPPQEPPKKRRELPQKLQSLKKQNSQNQIQINRQKIYSEQPLSNSQEYHQKMEFRALPSPPLHVYPNRVQNQGYNYQLKKVYKQNYYKQLLGQRRRLEQQANQISQLNRLFNAERYRKRQESRGLQDLRKLQKMLQSKNNEYLSLTSIDRQASNYEISGSKQTLGINTKKSLISDKINKDQWRKLD